MAVTAELRPVRVNQSCAEGATLVDWERPGLLHPKRDPGVGETGG